MYMYKDFLTTSIEVKVEAPEHSNKEILLKQIMA